MPERSILITGCSSGIGLHAARGLRAKGWRVFATCRKPSDVSRLQEEGLECHHLDYTDPDTIRQTVARVTEENGGALDALFNNGAIALPGANEDLPRAGLAHVLETNVIGPHDLSRQILPLMRRQGHGRIINCSSVLGLVSAPWRSAYVASKFAIEGLTDTLRIEMRDTPIDIILLEPGPITSDIRKNSQALFERYIDWENSPRVDQYRTSLMKRLYDAPGRDRFELSPEATTKALLRALGDKHPRARYRVTVPTRAMAWARRILPTNALDWLLARA